MSLNRQFTHHSHVHRFVVSLGDRGWEVREEEDTVVLSRVQRVDWHRVERDIQQFERKAEALRQAGWIEELAGLAQGS
ncbi:MAG: hypothetical protein AB7P99_11515 [Vicinamibacterales bacterium]